MSARLHHDASFRLRTLFIVMATCAAAFTVMAHSPDSYVTLLALCVPATWLVRGLIMVAHSMDYIHGWAVEPLRVSCFAVAMSIVVAEWFLLSLVVGTAMQWAFGRT